MAPRQIAGEGESWSSAWSARRTRRPWPTCSRISTQTFFRPHPLTDGEARRIADYAGRDVYALFFEEGRPVAYGLLRGWDEGYPVPSLGIGVRTDSQGRGIGRLMMSHLHAEAARRGASVLRLRVHPENIESETAV